MFEGVDMGSSAIFWILLAIVMAFCSLISYIVKLIIWSIKGEKATIVFEKLVGNQRFGTEERYRFEVLVKTDVETRFIYAVAVKQNKNGESGKLNIKIGKEYKCFYNSETSKFFITNILHYYGKNYSDV